MSLCGQYALDVKGAKEDIARLSNEVQYLRDTIESVQQLAKRGSASSAATIRKLQPCIYKCKSQLSRLTDKLNPGYGRKMIKKVGLRALTWPFRGKEVGKVVDALER